MTVPMYLLLGAAICVAVRAMFGLATLTERRHRRIEWERILDELWEGADDDLAA